MKKAKAKKDWCAVMEAGYKGLVWNPWDFNVLKAMVEAAQELALTDVPLLLLKMALEGNPKDININRFCGTKLEELDRINDAYQCWRRVSEMKPGDPETEAVLSRLTIARTIKETGYTAAPTKSATAKVTA
ncbi:MAG: hypothetical protein IJK97_13060, partial [Thermoguttaceae bacterium]|nr:hypothetical protein [Thermoguttaceae bacterium]